MKNKNVFILIALLFLVPQMVFASWWNPFSWFKKRQVAPKVVQIEKTEDQNLEQKVKDYLYKEELRKQSSEQKVVIKTDLKKETATKSTPVMTSPVVPVVVEVQKNNDKQCELLKNEFSLFNIYWKKIDYTNTNSDIRATENDLLTGFGLNSAVFNGSDFDPGYQKYLLNKGSFYTRIENLKLATLDVTLTSFGKTELDNLKTKVNKGLDLFKESFDLKLTGYTQTNSDKYVWVSGIQIMPRKNIEDSQSLILQGIERGKNGAYYFSSMNSDYLKIKSSYEEEFKNLACK